MSESDGRILDLIDQGSYSNALSLVKQKIAKFPNKSYYYALQNQILFKSGKKDQSSAESKKLLAKLPNDPATLSLMYETFNGIGSPAEANQVYEQIIKKYPTTSETSSLEWFDKSIDQFDLRIWNKIFIHLSKCTNSKRVRLYKFWNAFIYLSLIQSGSCTDNESTLFLKLGLRIIEDLKPFQEVQELFVYTTFLSLNGEYDQIESTIKDTELNLDLDMMVKYRDVLHESNNWSSLYEFTKKILFEQKLDDFISWKLLIKAGKNLGLDRKEIEGYFTTDSRNITLAKVELALVYQEGSIEDNILHYYDLFKHKLCCFNDIQGYLKEVDTAHFQEKITASTKQIIASNPTSLNDLTTLINNQKLSFFLDENLDKQAFKQTNWQVYKLYKDNNTINGGEFDNNPVNELSVISIILDLTSTSTPSIEIIVNSIATIEQLLKKDQYNHKLRLWLIKLYSSLNTNNLISYHYNAMKIKMLQHESLGHNLVNMNPSKDNLKVLITIYQFYLNSDSEIKTSIIKGFDSGVFNKLLGFIDLGKKLNDSLFRRFVILTIIKFSLILNDQNYLSYFIDTLKSLDLEQELSDNRDKTSEWKVGIFEELHEALNPNSEAFDVTDLKLQSLRYLVLYSNDLQHYKNFNKVFSKFKSKSPFKNLINQVYLNVLKIHCQPNAKDLDSAKNYLLKNLKFDKLRNSMIPEDHLSWELNHNISLFVELSRIVDSLYKRTKSFESIKACIDSSKKELKPLNLVQKQVEKLNDTSSKIEVVDDSINIKETITAIKESIQESWFKSI